MFVAEGKNAQSVKITYFYLGTCPCAFKFKIIIDINSGSVTCNRTAIGATGNFYTYVILRGSSSKNKLLLLAVRYCFLTDLIFILTF